MHIPIRKRDAHLAKRTGNDLLDWAHEQKAVLQSKYNLATRSSSASSSSSAKVKRNGSTNLTNVQYDSTWVATITGGTPSRDYNVVLDTGSADLWIASQYYNPAASSSFRNVSTPFNIQYGSGEVVGYEATDTFTLAETTVQDLHFAVADAVSSGLVNNDMEGIMGMGFQKLAASGYPPFWEAANINTFAFYLERASLTSPSIDQPGGLFTLGGTNTSLYQGSINYVPLIEELYWLVRLDGAGTRGTDVDLQGLSRTAVDTGTTLIGAPTSVVAELYGNIPNSKSQGNGYYSFPCSESIDATLTFGSVQYTIPDSDFIAGTLDSSGTECLGSFFGLDTSSTADLQWIVGDAFLKNVYSIFTTDSPNGAAVGFASLANGLNSGTQSRTVSTSTTNSGSGSTTTSPAAPSSKSMSMAALAAAVALPLLSLLVL